MAASLLKKLIPNKVKNAYKATTDYLSTPNQAPQQFIQGYEDSIGAIGKGKVGDNFDTARFLDPTDAYEDLNNAGMAAMRKEVLKGIESETLYTQRGMEGMLENFEATGNLYSGFNKAGETQGSPLVNLLSGTTDNAAKNAAGLLGTVGLAGGVNTMMGGDFGEGAMVGGLAAFSARGISQAYMKNMGGMEQSFMKSMLGDAYTTAGTTEIKQGTRLMDLSDAAKRNLTMEDVGYTKGKKGRSIQDFLSTHSGKGPAERAKTRADVKKTVSPEEARRMNLQEIATNPKVADTKEAKAFIERKGPSRVMEHNRSMTIGGGMLAGVAFTGRSDKRDYRRGFNSHRGNRI